MMIIIRVQSRSLKYFIMLKRQYFTPIALLFDQETRTLKPHCVGVLQRIFVFCDHDMDDARGDGELNELQFRCLNAPVQTAEIIGVKRVVQEKLAEGVNDLGLALTGFLCPRDLFIEKESGIDK